MSQSSPDVPRSRRKRRLLPSLVVGVVVVASAIWAGGWFFARSKVAEELDRVIDRLAASGVKVACPDRSIGGFPFRFEIGCDGPEVEIVRQGTSLTVSRAKIVVQAWDPHLVLAQFEGPVEIATPAGVFEGTAHALGVSLRWSLRGVDRLSLAAEGLDGRWTATDGPVTRLVAERLELHGRDDGERRTDLDLALVARKAVLFKGDKREGPEASDLDLSIRLNEFLPLVPPEPARVFAGRGGRIEPIRLTYASAGLVFNGKGALRLLPDGQLDGTIGVAAQGLERLALGASKSLGVEATALASGFVLLGKPSADPDLPGRRLELVVDHGRPHMGRVVFPPLRPLFFPVP